MDDNALYICTDPFDMRKPPRIVFNDEDCDVIVVDTAIEDDEES